jgi:type IV secretory pathway VirJ component
LNRPRTARWRKAAIALVALALVLVNAPRLHLLGWNQLTDFSAEAGKRDVGAVLVSGDVGLTLGISASTAQGLAANGYDVTGVSSPVAFAHHLTRAQADAVVINAIDAALAKGVSKVVLVGQSFGSDIIATVLPDLPERLHDKIASVVIVVPSQDVYFRADPSGLAYIGKPDALPAAALREVDWVPLTCVQGAQESASLCPLLAGSPVRRIVLPGNHYLHHDDTRVLATILDALQRR